MDGQLTDLGHVPWILLQSGEQTEDPELPLDRLQSLLLPIVGPELRDAIESLQVTTRCPRPLGGPGRAAAHRPSGRPAL